MKKIASLIMAMFVAGTLQAQKKFKVGDKVELFVAGDASHGVIVSEYEDTDYGYGTYRVHLDGEKYCSNHTTDSRYNAEFVRERFQPDSEAKLAVGGMAEVRRYDGKVYKGLVLGKDEYRNRYEVRYERDGYETSDWFHVNNTRQVATAQPVAKNTPAQPVSKVVMQPTPAPTPNPAPATAPAAWAGQKFQVGDRVLYNDLGFLTKADWGTVVSIDPKKRLYTIRDEYDASWKYSYAPHQVLNPAKPIDNSFFIGKWEVHIQGATSTFSKNGDNYRRFSGGMKLPPLEIKADGTYTWVVAQNKVIRGKWQPRKDVPGIVLLKAMDGLDYTLYEKTEAFATTSSTRDEIGLHHLPSSTGYYHAYRIGPNKSELLVNRRFE
ncbi:hypothetical protein ACXYMU_12840 [Pontibacter sp. CAU 1760]